MGKALRVVVTVVLTGAVLLMALPAAAASNSVGPLVCWNNCGIGGIDAKTM